MLDKVIRSIRRLLLAPLLMVATACPVYAEDASETAVKIAFIFNFFKFIEWPAEMENRDKFLLCANAEGVVSEGLQLLDGKTVNGKLLSVRRDLQGEALRACHMVLYGKSRYRYSSRSERLSRSHCRGWRRLHSTIRRDWLGASGQSPQFRNKSETGSGEWHKNQSPAAEAGENCAGRKMSKLPFSALGKTIVPPFIRWRDSNALLQNYFMDYTLAMTVVVLFALHIQAVQAAAPLPEKAPLKDLTTLSLEELLNIQVTSATKSSTRLSDAPAAIYVLTNEDIQRTGATTIPEALRVVPGLNVARIDANKWGVSARGFNDQFANKLLVLIDGRSIYTPLFSGVRWDQQGVMMEDIERIEVIRGPGASLWGANAVNGVINIITKNARDTRHALASGHGGNERRGGGLRYGAEVGKDAYLKVYGRYTMHDDEPSQTSNGDSGDNGNLKKFGFRYDKELATHNKLMFQGDVLEGYSGGAPRGFVNMASDGIPVLTPPYSNIYSTSQEFNGYHLLGHWEHVQG